MAMDPSAMGGTPPMPGGMGGPPPMGGPMGAGGAPAPPMPMPLPPINRKRRKGGKHKLSRRKPRKKG